MAIATWLTAAIFCATASLICGRRAELYASSGSPAPAFSHPMFADNHLQKGIGLRNIARKALMCRGDFRRSSSSLSELHCTDHIRSERNEVPQGMRFHTSNQKGQTFPRRTQIAQNQRGDIQVGTLMVDGLRTYYKTVMPAVEKEKNGAHPLVLVHGFGISSDHFAKNMHEIADLTGAPVHAIDLIGFGRSDKPGAPVYGIELWQRQLEAFLDEVVQADKVFLAGNSIGGYVCMNVAADRPSLCAGLSLINSAGTWGAINPFGVPVPWLSWKPIARALGKLMFEAARKPEHVARTLQRVYVDKSQVDDALIESILSPSRTPEAELAGPELFCSLFLAPLGRTWEQLLGGAEGYKGPTMALWGDKDPWLNPGYVGLLEGLRSDLEVRWIYDCGHCPHHERPDLVNKRLAEWILRLSFHAPHARLEAPAEALAAEVEEIEAEVGEMLRRSRRPSHGGCHWDTPGHTWLGWDIKGHTN